MPDAYGFTRYGGPQEQRFLDGAHPEELTSATAQFLGQYYADAAQVPREILLSYEPEEQEVIADWLRKLRGAKVEAVWEIAARGRSD